MAGLIFKCEARHFSSSASLSFFILLFIININVILSQRKLSCGEDEFFDETRGICKACTKECPDGHFKIPCKKDSDLECKPYIVLPPEIFQGKDIPTFEETKHTAYYEDSKFDYDNSGKSQDENSSMSIEKEDQEYWKVLAFALIGLLSILIVATVAVLIACFRLQRAVALKQQEEVEIVDTDSDYVVIRAIRSVSDPRPSHIDMEYRNDLPSHSMLLEPTSDYGGSDSMHDFQNSQPQSTNQLCFLPKVYNPQRRLLSYDADDVFESEDSGGSVRFPSLPRLKTIPESQVKGSHLHQTK